MPMKERDHYRMPSESLYGDYRRIAPQQKIYQSAQVPQFY